MAQIHYSILGYREGLSDGFTGTGTEKTDNDDHKNDGQDILCLFLQIILSCFFSLKELFSQ